MNPEQNPTNATAQQEPAPSEQPSTSQARPCPHDCARCTPWQQIYCVTRMTYDMSATLNNMREELVKAKQEIGQLKSLLTPASDQFIDPTAQ